MAKKAKTKQKSTKKRNSKKALAKDNSIVWALIVGIVLAICVIWYFNS